MRTIVRMPEAGAGPLEIVRIDHFHDNPRGVFSLAMPDTVAAMSAVHRTGTLIDCDLTAALVAVTNTRARPAGRSIRTVASGHVPSSAVRVALPFRSKLYGVLCTGHGLVIASRRYGTITLTGLMLSSENAVSGVFEPLA